MVAQTQTQTHTWVVVVMGSLGVSRHLRVEHIGSSWHVISDAT